ncbi:MAG: type II secretion system protein GspM [Rhizobiaceae bacterium]|nr:type II secretion system protein GspM [Rhizobiaceae bacterium]
MVSLTSIMNTSLGAQRLIATAILIFFVSLMSLTAYFAVSTFKSNASEIVEKRFSLGRLVTISELGAALEQQPSQPIADGASQEFLEGTNEAVILAGLQGRLNSMAKAHKIEVQAVANLPIRQRDGIRFAGVAADVQGTDEAVHSLLFDIETTTPYLVIRKVNLRSVSVVNSRQKGPPILLARVEFFGALSPSLEAEVTQ